MRAPRGTRAAAVVSVFIDRAGLEPAMVGVDTGHFYALVEVVAASAAQVRHLYAAGGGGGGGGETVEEGWIL